MLYSIFTQNSPKNLTRILKSFDSQNDMRYDQILIYDNSDKYQTILENKNIAASYRSQINPEGMSIINRNNWPEIKHYTLDHFDNSLVLDFFTGINLGEDGYSTGRIRNTAILINYIIGEEHNYISNFDDDMILVEDLHNLPLNKIKNISGMRLKGSPDFSRLNWIEFYLYTLYEEIFGSGALTYNSYPTVLFSLMSTNQRLYLIKQYTQFYIQDSLRITAFKPEYTYPPREEVSGGAYISMHTALEKAVFPKFYNEDWIWALSVRNQREKTSFLAKSIIHAGLPKNVLAMDRLKAEENGEIYDRVLRYFSLDIKRIREYKEARIQYLKELITLVLKLKTELNATGYYSQLTKIKTAVEDLLAQVRGYNTKQIYNNLKTYSNLNKLWEKEAKKLNNNKQNLRKKINLAINLR